MGNNPKLKGLTQSIFRIENAIVLFFFIAIFLVLFLQFFTRYVMNDSLGWTEEIARMLLICLCFTAAVINARNNSAIALEFTSSRLSINNRNKLERFVIKPISAGIYLWITVLMFEYTQKSRQSLSSIPISKKYIIWLITICFFAMTVHSVIAIIKGSNTDKDKE